jgi:hypothetical protein
VINILRARGISTSTSKTVTVLHLVGPSFYDWHVIAAHYLVAGKSGRQHCLADYCGILGGCRPSDRFADDSTCNVKVAARLHHSCLLLVNTCFGFQEHSDPLIAEHAAVAATKFRSKFCSALNCQNSLKYEDSEIGGFWERSRWFVFCCSPRCTLFHITFSDLCFLLYF